MRDENIPLPGLMRIGGGLYILIIAFGLFAEFAVRMPLAGADPEAFEVAAPMLRLGLAADAMMIAADVALAVVLYAMLVAVSPMVALAAMVLRLIQAALIGAGLMLMIGAVVAPDHGQWLMEAQAMGYDLGLVFFGLNTALMSWLLARSGWAPRWLPPLLALAAAVYLIGSFSAVLAPGFNALFQPAYLIVLVSELAFALWLLVARPTGAARPQRA